MLEPISISFIALGYAALTPYARANNAISSDSIVVQKKAVELIDNAEQSRAIFGPKAALIDALEALASECVSRGWDGGDALPLKPMALSNAKTIIRLLPTDLPFPELAPEPDGAISLDWIKSKKQIFSLSVGPSSRLAYAWIDGTDKGHAVARFDGQKLPGLVVDTIRMIVGDANVTLRAA